MPALRTYLRHVSVLACCFHYLAKRHDGGFSKAACELGFINKDSFARQSGFLKFSSLARENL